MGNAERDRAQVPATDLVVVDGDVLLWVAAGRPSERAVARTLDVASARRAILADPADYLGLVGVIERAGAEVGHVWTESFDPGGGRIDFRTDADSSTPFDQVRFGRIAVREDGTEKEEIRPRTR